DARARGQGASERGGGHRASSARCGSPRSHSPARPARAPGSAALAVDQLEDVLREQDPEHERGEHHHTPTLPPGQPGGQKRRASPPPAILARARAFDYAPPRPGAGWTTMIEVENLKKSYGSHAAVRGLSFEVPSGQVCGFLGPNGAGKSTTLRMLTGFVAPTEGTIKIGGIDALARPIEARRQIGYMPEACPLYPEMRVDEYLRYRAELKGVPRRE